MNLSVPATLRLCVEAGLLKGKIVSASIAYLSLYRKDGHPCTYAAMRDNICTFLSIMHQFPALPYAVPFNIIGDVGNHLISAVQSFIV